MSVEREQTDILRQDFCTVSKQIIANVSQSKFLATSALEEEINLLLKSSNLALLFHLMFEFLSLFLFIYCVQLQCKTQGNVDSGSCLIF